ncbi:putative metal-binding motif-containing protein [Polyangium sp. 15x6]|uniref:putative metal-binding motif-containing protein n=1 Tax=Polyangium sp. 15x6 TaxID=3042687 RepID=UPI00249C7D0D|nr:putative metal-binding motif-containing protein [Polyangium sp. 15x6]MDI3291241.1 putative metal-binding motif-containing protein [Polyangium sp. 15x6]
MIMRSFAFPIRAALPAALLLCIPSAAFAAPSLTVENTGQPATLPGDITNDFNILTIKSGAVLRVLAKGSGPSTGRLHIRANRIIIESDGTIDATGSGHPGKAGLPGEGMGGGYVNGSSAGGGGAYFGGGGDGTTQAPGCGGPFGLGGAPYGNPSMLDLGSAGGSGSSTPGMGASGGNGGGGVWLQAARIEINGTIEANGANGNLLANIGAGGGAGGHVILDAYVIDWLPKAKITAKGGAGGIGTVGVGGSGGGGIVRIHASSVSSPPVGVIDVSGGPPPEGCSTGMGDQGTNEFDDQNVECPDFDGDGVRSILCAETDCDDTNGTIAPGLPEVCNGVDDNCNSEIDEDATCPGGLKCQGGKCGSEVSPDAGPTTDGGAPAAPQTVEYRGGCSLAPAAQGGFALAGLGLVAALAARLARRARKAR